LVKHRDPSTPNDPKGRSGQGGEICKH